jgi:hypothetical protein
LSDAAETEIQHTYALCFAVQMAARLLSDGKLDVNELGRAGQQFLLRIMDEETLEAAEQKLAALYGSANAVLNDALAPYAGKAAL